MKPIIILNGGSAYDRQFERPSLVLNKTYSNAIAAAGAIPVMSPESEAIQEYARWADGLILTGSITFAPKAELKEEVRKQEETERNIFDVKLFHAFMKEKKPILGICLGLQVMNEASEGGTLIDDFKLQDGVEHMMTKHLVEAVPESILFKLFGREFYVNSRHNRRIGELAKGFNATAYSPDHVIEAFEHAELPVFGVEWHPERMRGDMPEPPEGPDMTLLFEAFADMCVKSREGR